MKPSPPNDLSLIAKKLHDHPFIASRFLQNYHIQTLFSKFSPYLRGANIEPERRYVQLSDGSRLIADCLLQQNEDRQATVVVLSGYEGYQGSEVSGFAKRLGAKAYYLGFNVIHLKQRAEGDSIHLTKSLFATFVGIDDVNTALKAFTGWG